MASLIKDKLSSSRSPRSSIDGSRPEDHEADQYRLLVTAGPSYDTSTHKIVHVNTSTPTVVSNDFLTASIKVRIRGYRGLPSHSPSSSAYFDDAVHSKDQYSVGFSFVPKVDLPSVDTVWGNDFDHPVSDRLPPGFNTAFKIVKDFIDPGLECDAYAQKPWLYGPSLSCWFAFGVGEKGGEDSLAREREEKDDVLREGADGQEGREIRKQLGIPENSEKRRKHFLSAANREHFTFEKGRTYHGDFYNPYLDFGNFALKLPGFSIRVIKYVDDKSHRLRYVFKNRKTGDVYFCVNLNLLWGDELRAAMQDEQKGVEKQAGAEKEETGAGMASGRQLNGDAGKEAKAASRGGASDAKSGEREGQLQKPPPSPALSAVAPPAQDANGSPAPQKPSAVSEGASAQGPNGCAAPQKPAEAEPGMTDKPAALAEEVKDMNMQDTLQGTASAQKSGGKTGVLEDGGH